MISSAQLSLFDTATAEVGSLYKAGDYVKLKRKPAIAAWVKRGEIYKINKVHPIDGSLQFWNPHTNEWDFLYPDEVTLAPAPPEIDSVSPASTISDTEYTAESADTEYTAESADTEYTAESADTEYAVEPVDIDSVSRAISIYSPRGTARSGEYFRFSYRDGSRMRHIHIRGGNTDSPISQAKVAEVRSLLAAGTSPGEVAAMLRICGKAPLPSCD
ncbi:hypothetical protein QUA56_08110 [Microcoleus sp. N3A4]|uniref:hypothetical protein n=1 Tax=Microcoleus sp. N3A4 TaxID=3055379 RepID=UPI002FD270E5